MTIQYYSVFHLVHQLRSPFSQYYRIQKNTKILVLALQMNKECPHKIKEAKTFSSIFILILTYILAYLHPHSIYIYTQIFVCCVSNKTKLQKSELPHEPIKIIELNTAAKTLITSNLSYCSQYHTAIRKSLDKGRNSHLWGSFISVPLKFLQHQLG